MYVVLSRGEFVDMGILRVSARKEESRSGLDGGSVLRLARLPRRL